MPSILRISLLSLLLGLAVAACGGGGGSTSAPTTAKPTSAAPTGPAASASATAAAGSTIATINANTANVDELQAAFAAAGISNADRWAREVAEYRPYDADPTWAKLRQELGKYNIDPVVLEQILAILTV